jgi:predicted nuclease of restriction endonuclease-like (RecB) superfamily
MMDKQKIKTGVAATGNESAFQCVLDLIVAARGRAERAVNTAVIELYWSVGEYLSCKIVEEGWGKGTVASLSEYIQHRQPGIRGYSSQNLWRMRQFFETYRDQLNLSTLLREIPWSAHLHILSGARSAEEREFYLRVAAENRWPGVGIDLIRRVLANLQNDGKVRSNALVRAWDANGFVPCCGA